MLQPALTDRTDLFFRFKRSQTPILGLWTALHTSLRLSGPEARLSAPRPGAHASGQRGLVLESPLAGEYHRHLGGRLVRGHEALVVADGPAGMGDGGDALADGGVQGVPEREKGIGDQDRTGKPPPRLGRLGPEGL